MDGRSRRSAESVSGGSAFGVRRSAFRVQGSGFYRSREHRTTEPENPAPENLRTRTPNAERVLRSTDPPAVRQSDQHHVGTCCETIHYNDTSRKPLILLGFLSLRRSPYS